MVTKLSVIAIAGYEQRMGTEAKEWFVKSAQSLETKLDELYRKAHTVTKLMGGAVPSSNSMGILPKHAEAAALNTLLNGAYAANHRLSKLVARDPRPSLHSLFFKPDDVKPPASSTSTVSRPGKSNN